MRHDVVDIYNRRFIVSLFKCDGSGCLLQLFLIRIDGILSFTMILTATFQLRRRRHCIWIACDRFRLIYFWRRRVPIPISTASRFVRRLVPTTSASASVVAFIVRRRRHFICFQRQFRRYSVGSDDWFRRRVCLYYSSILTTGSNGISFGFMRQLDFDSDTFCLVLTTASDDWFRRYFVGSPQYEICRWWIKSSNMSPQILCCGEL